MSSSLKIGDVAVALSQRLFPSVTTWNRLEARPRSQTFERALKAEVRDALWMLTKQWQMGEFRGSDAGSPVFAKILFETTRLTKYRPGADGAAELFDASVPLEAKVERRPVPMRRGKMPLSLNLRLVMGRHWLALIADIADYRLAFRTAYPIANPDPKKKESRDVSAHPEALDTFQAVAGRAMDGGALLDHLTSDASHRACDGVGGIAAADVGPVNGRAERFLAWAARFLYQPTAPVPPGTTDSAWIPERLEYQFAVSAPRADGTEKVYLAEEYYSGRLDWYSLDVDGSGAALGPVPGADLTGLPADAPFSTIPVPVSFSGMPNTRWWTFEDRRTNFGDIDVATTDLAKLLFMEFALVYANDWFVIPCTLPSGALAKVQGLAVTNVFGERFWVEAANRGADQDANRWSMYTVNIRNAPAGGTPADTTLLLLPTLAKGQMGAPLEEVMLVRDEVANMVWGVESTVALPTGVARPGRETGAQTLSFLEALTNAGPMVAPGPMTASSRYRVISTVPENWIPFIPVHVPGDNREIQLQRAAMPRVIPGDPLPPQKIQPLTAILRQGLDLTKAQTYFVHEEEVPRAGARVTQYFSRARWTGGEVFNWLRTRKQTGRGEAASGLAFDELVDQSSKEV
jgi:hypothetical protein